MSLFLSPNRKIRLFLGPFVVAVVLFLAASLRIGTAVNTFFTHTQYALSIACLRRLLLPFFIVRFFVQVSRERTISTGQIFCYVNVAILRAALEICFGFCSRVAFDQNGGAIFFNFGGEICSCRWVGGRGKQSYMGEGGRGGGQVIFSTVWNYILHGYMYIYSPEYMFIYLVVRKNNLEACVRFTQALHLSISTGVFFVEFPCRSIYIYHHTGGGVVVKWFVFGGM